MYRTPMTFQGSQTVLQSPYAAWICLLTMRSRWVGRHLGCRLVVEQVPHSQVDGLLAYYWVFWVREYTGGPWGILGLMIPDTRCINTKIF